VQQVDVGLLSVLVEDVVGQLADVAFSLGNGRDRQVVQLQLQHFERPVVGEALLPSLCLHQPDQAAEVQQDIAVNADEFQLQEGGDQAVRVADDGVPLYQQRVPALAAVL
jgi:hypothetical protein